MQIAIVLLMAVVSFAPAAENAEYHTPADIIKIIDQSDIVYSIEQLNDKDKIPQPKSELNEHGTFLRKNEDGSFMVTTYVLEQESNSRFNSLLAKAEKEFNSRNFSAARTIYQDILKIDPNNSQIMTYVGQTYEEENKSREAIEMYRKAIAANFLDYMAHWFLADMLITQKKFDEAAHEITIAHLLNRNNPRILEGLKYVYKKAGRFYPEWTFTPRCILTSESPTSVSLKTDMAPEWMAYGLCKAVWHYEPSYREAMLRKTRDPQILAEEYECLLMLVTSVMLDENKKPTDPAIRALVNAAKQKNLQEYAIYEIVLREQPQFIFILHQKSIMALADYLLEIRSRKIT